MLWESEKTAEQWWSLSCRPLQTDFGQFSDLWQTTDKFRTDFRRQTPTSDFGPWYRLRTSDFGFWTSDFKFHTTDLRLWTDFELQTSEFERQTLNFRLRVRTLDIYTSDRPRPLDFELRSLNFRLWTISIGYFRFFRTLDFKLQTLRLETPTCFNTLNS